MSSYMMTLQTIGRHESGSVPSSCQPNVSFLVPPPGLSPVRILNSAVQMGKSALIVNSTEAARFCNLFHCAARYAGYMNVRCYSVHMLAVRFPSDFAVMSDAAKA